MSFLFALVALATVGLTEVQTFKHVADHVPHVHEHHRRSARRQGA